MQKIEWVNGTLSLGITLHPKKNKIKKINLNPQKKHPKNGTLFFTLSRVKKHWTESLYMQMIHPEAQLTYFHADLLVLSMDVEISLLLFVLVGWWNCFHDFVFHEKWYLIVYYKIHNFVTTYLYSLLYEWWIVDTL